MCNGPGDSRHADMPIVTLSGTPTDALQYVQRLRTQLRDEAHVSRAVYERLAAQFPDLSSQSTVTCVLVEPFQHREHPVRVRFETHRSDDAWEMSLQHQHVNTLLGVDIVNETYEGMTYRQTQSGAPRNGELHLFFYRWTGIHLPMPSWALVDSLGTHYPSVGRGLYFTKQVRKMLGFTRHRFVLLTCVSGVRWSTQTEIHPRLLCCYPLKFNSYPPYNTTTPSLVDEQNMQTMLRDLQRRCTVGAITSSASYEWP